MAYLKLEIDGDVALIWLDRPGEKMNTLTTGLGEEFQPLLAQLEKDSRVRAIVLISAKEDNFVAGADIEMLQQSSEPGSLARLSRTGQSLMDRLADFPKPVVAAINGAALGGGLELAMSCHYRIVTENKKTVLGLPEVKLGLNPGSGGTQNAPALVGIRRALDMMLTGKNIYPFPAKKMGLVDMVVHPYALKTAAVQAARKMADGKLSRKFKKPLLGRILEDTPLRSIIFSQARKMTQKQTLGNYPAPFGILDCVAEGASRGRAAGLAREAECFEELGRTPQSRELINLFFAITGQKRNPGRDEVREVGKVGVLGAGLMGAGIAQVSADKGYPVVMKDISREALAHGEKNIWDAYKTRVRKRVISPFERDQVVSRVAATTDYQGLRRCDLVIEAVFEDLDLKRRVLADCEAVLPEKAIFASNTSSLPISDIAAGAQRPGQVIGMHYFSPVPKMPLLEIIVTGQTENWVSATAFEVGVRQGKTVIVVKDGPGFYTTRILAPMLNEALFLLEEGGEIRHIDRVMKQFGFPVGPITLIDEVGIDVGAHVAGVMSPLFTARGEKPTEVMKKLTEEGYKGRKNRMGFYHYDEQAARGWRGFVKKKKEVNQNIYKFFGGPNRKQLDPVEIHDRLTLIMVNEAARCLEEGILSSPVDGDLGAVMGLGFPPFLGGPFRYLDSLGGEAVLAKFGDLARNFGQRFQPAEIIVSHARAQKSFY